LFNKTFGVRMIGSSRKAQNRSASLMMFADTATPDGIRKELR
jgi:hypothetical protein